MSISKNAALLALFAVAKARFGQEQVPVEAVQALDGQFGDAGAAATIAGSIPQALLAASSPCDKLTIADQMIDELGTDQAVIDAAIGLVSAETNFNPFAVDVPFVCADPALPVNEQLRGITPLVDPDVDGAAAANTASEESVATPFDAAGLSQAEVMIEQGFTSFQAVDAAGENIALAGQDGEAGAGAGGDAGADDGAADDGAANDGAAGDDGAAEEEDVIDADDGAEEEEEVVDDTPIECGGGVVAPGNGAGNGTEVDTGNGGADDAGGDVEEDVEEDVDEDVEEDAGDEAGNDAGGDAGAGNGGDLDFGACQPTIAFVGGLNGRPADEFTFIPQDPLVAEGQQEALNPNIITNRICDQLLNVCDAAEDAIAACEDAQAEIEALGTRDAATADTWNALLGFDGVDSSVESI